MRIIRGKPATGKSSEIVCTGCGKRAAEAGVAVRDLAVETAYGPESMLMIDENKIQPLCAECVTAWERARPVRNKSQ
jgi:hypothetical protein